MSTGQIQSSWVRVKFPSTGLSSQVRVNYKQLQYIKVPEYGLKFHSGRYGHKNETPISQNFVFIIKFQSCINPYEVSKMF